MRFRHHIRKACSFYIKTTGATAHASLQPFARNHVQRRLYQCLLRGEEAQQTRYLNDRLTARGLDAAAVRENVSRLLRSTAQGHRWTLFHWLLNMVPTSRRCRFLPQSTVDDRVGACLFCKRDEDSIEHYCDCDVLRASLRK